MTPRIPFLPDPGPIRIAVVGAPRPDRPRFAGAGPIKRPDRRPRPTLLDADLDGPAVLASRRRPVAARLVGVVGPIGLAAFLAVGYAVGLKLYTNVSPLEHPAIAVLAGFFAFFLLAVWPTFDDEGAG